MNGQRWPNSNSQKTFFMCFAKKQVRTEGVSEQYNYVLYEGANEINASAYM